MRPNTITAEAVCKVYRDAAPRWNPPDEADCEAVAMTLAMYQGAKAGLDVARARKFDTAGRRRVARAENVREAIGTLLLDLPELVQHLAGRAPGDTEHAQSLVDLLGAARKVAALWPSFDGTLRKFDPRTDWARTADCIVGQILAAWQRANPKHTIGKPLSHNQPMTRVLAGLLHMIGHEGITPEQIAKHFNRDKSGFVLLDAARDS